MPSRPQARGPPPCTQWAAVMTRSRVELLTADAEHTASPSGVVKKACRRCGERPCSGRGAAGGRRGRGGLPAPGGRNHRAVGAEVERGRCGLPSRRPVGRDAGGVEGGAHGVLDTGQRHVAAGGPGGAGVTGVRGGRRSGDRAECQQHRRRDRHARTGAPGPRAEPRTVPATPRCASCSPDRPNPPRPPGQRPNRDEGHGWRGPRSEDAPAPRSVASALVGRAVATLEVEEGFGRRGVVGVLFQVLHPTEDDEVVAALVDGVDRAVEVRQGARDDGRSGDAAGSQSRPANLSMPLVAICAETCSWSAARMLTQNRPERWMSGQARDVRAGMKVTRGGSRETLAKDWQVMPTARRDSSP